MDNVENLKQLYDKKLFTTHYVKEEQVMCENDHPRVYYSFKDGVAVCGYCNTRFIQVKEEE